MASKMSITSLAVLLLALLLAGPVTEARSLKSLTRQQLIEGVQTCSNQNKVAVLSDSAVSCRGGDANANGELLHEGLTVMLIIPVVPAGWHLVMCSW